MPPGQLAVLIDGVADGMLKRRWLGQENITAKPFDRPGLAPQGRPGGGAEAP